MRKPLLLILLLAMLVPAVAGCNRQVVYNPSITGTSELIVQKFVWASPLNVHLKPGPDAPEDMVRQAKVLFVPFRLDQNVGENRNVARSLSRAFWSMWSGDGILTMSHFEETAYNYSVMESARLGQRHGADLVVTGVIPYFMAGGSSGNSVLSLRLNIIEAATGRVLWSMEQTAQMEAAFTEDYIALTRRIRLPNDPLWAITRSLARNMAQPLLPPVKEEEESTPTTAENAAVPPAS